MTRSNLVKLVREVLQELDEANVTGGTATFTPGTGAQYATPHAFGKGKRAKKQDSFKARHAKNIKRGPMSAAYWADKVKW